jgi:hypothetical protein
MSYTLSMHVSVSTIHVLLGSKYLKHLVAAKKKVAELCRGIGYKSAQRFTASWTPAQGGRSEGQKLWKEGLLFTA